MALKFNSAQQIVIDQDNRNMALGTSGVDPMSKVLNDMQALIDTGNIGITADAKDVDSIALGGGHFGYDAATTSGLIFGYRLGRILVGHTVKTVGAGTLTLAASNTNYVEVDGSGAGTVSSNTSGFTTGRMPLYTVVTGVSTISTITNAKVLLGPATPAAITGDMLSTPGATKAINAQLGASIAATTSFLIQAPNFAATLAAARFANSTGFATSDTDYWTWAIKNRGAAGAGTTDMLDTGAVNTTKTTGGSLLTAKASRGLTLNATGANLITAANDTLEITLTKTGAPAALTLSEIRLDFGFTA